MIKEVRTKMRRRRLTPVLLFVLLWIVAVGFVGVQFVAASEAARSSDVDMVKSYALFGMPVLEGFRNDGRFGVHMHWGALVLVIAPFLLGILVAVVRASRSLAPSTKVGGSE